MGMGTPPGSQNPERDAKIVRLWFAGLSKTEIGNVCGISRQRVDDVLVRELGEDVVRLGAAAARPGVVA